MCLLSLSRSCREKSAPGLANTRTILPGKAKKPKELKAEKLMESKQHISTHELSRTGKSRKNKLPGQKDMTGKNKWNCYKPDWS